MKIVHTASGLEKKDGGPARSVPGLCEALAGPDKTVELFVISRRGREKYINIPNQQMVYTNVVRAFGRGWYRWAPAYDRKLDRAVEVDEPCILHDHGLWLHTNQVAARVARRRQLPFVISVRGMLTPWSMGYRSVRKRVAWRAYENRHLQTASAFHATAEDEAQFLREFGFKQPIIVTPNGVTIPPYEKVVVQDPTRRRRMLFLSRVHPKKGLLNLIKALQRVDMTGWEVLLAGPDENNHQAEVQAAIDAAGLSSQVRFIGEVSDEAKWGLYASSDLFVLPTLSENFGIVIAEALAAGTPVVTTTGTPWTQLATHQAGWCVEPTPEALAGALTQAVALSDAERNVIGRRGRQLIETQFSWETIATQMLDAYRWLLDRSTALPDHVLVD